jgi:hypothetical protein
MTRPPTAEELRALQERQIEALARLLAAAWRAKYAPQHQDDERRDDAA